MGRIRIVEQDVRENIRAKAISEKAQSRQSVRKGLSEYRVCPSKRIQKSNQQASTRFTDKEDLTL